MSMAYGNTIAVYAPTHVAIVADLLRRQIAYQLEPVFSTRPLSIARASGSFLTCGGTVLRALRAITILTMR